MKKVATEIPGYTYGSADVPTSPLSLEELEKLTQSVGFTAEDERHERHLRLAGEVLADQAKELVDTRRGIIIPL